MTTENQTLQQLLAERVTAFADSDRPREIIDKAVLESGIGAASYLTFTTEASEDVKTSMLLTNEAQVVRALGALLDNAAKFSDAEGTIRVNLRAERNEAILSVGDNGHGIEAELLPRVFDLFMQGPRSLDRNQGGLGIGLSLVRNLTALHGGTDPDLLDEVAWWQSDDFWQYALFATAAHIRAAASRAGVAVRQDPHHPAP